MIDDLSALAAVLLAVSLATERLVTILKTIIPQLADDNTSAPDARPERMRRFLVQLLAFWCAWLTVAFLHESGFGLIGTIEIGPGNRPIPLVVLAILASGGSAFWNNVLGYTRAVKEIRVQERERAVLRHADALHGAGAGPS